VTIAEEVKHRTKQSVCFGFPESSPFLPQLRLADAQT
jgi:hypothetical protein